MNSLKLWRETEDSRQSQYSKGIYINPPHEDLWVECILEDDQNRIIDNSGLFVTRDMLFANFRYQACNNLIPGNYCMVLKSSGKEIARRPFKLNGAPVSLPSTGELMTN